MTIADLSSVWVQADIFERDLHSIAAGQKADVDTPAYPADHFSARMSRASAPSSTPRRDRQGAVPRRQPGLG